MANRSDFNSKLPRQLKRMLALHKFPNAHAYGEVKRLWLEAHDKAKRSHNLMLKSRSVALSNDDE